MRPAKHLGLLQYTMRERLRRLDVMAAAACLAYPAREGRVTLSYVVIELLSAWTEFLRTYFLSCILNPKRVRGGRVRATTFVGATFNDAMTVAMTLHKHRMALPAGGVWHRRDEPTWFNPHVFLTSCQALGVSNIAQIQNALSAQTRVMIDLPAFRNYVAHRNENSARSARRIAAHYTIPGFKHPLQVLCTLPHRRPQPLLREWISDLDVLVEFLCA